MFAKNVKEFRSYASSQKWKSDDAREGVKRARTFQAMPAARPRPIPMATSVAT